MRTASSIDFGPAPPATLTRTSVPSRDAPPTGASTSAARAVASSSRMVISITVAPSRSLSWVGGALGDHRAVVDDHDVVGEHVGLLQVLRGEQHRRAAAHQLLDHAPELVATLRVESGRGFVEEEHRRPVHQRGREVEPAAHPAGVGARRGGRPRASSANCSSSSVGAGVDLAAVEVGELADQRQVLAAGEVLVDRGVLAGEADASPARVAGPLSRRRRARGAEPPSGRSSVVSIRTAVVLPAPLGPRSPSTRPSGTSNDTPFTASTSPKRFTRLSATIAGSVTPASVARFP